MKVARLKRVEAGTLDDGYWDIGRWILYDGYVGGWAILRGVAAVVVGRFAVGRLGRVAAVRFGLSSVSFRPCHVDVDILGTSVCQL